MANRIKIVIFLWMLTTTYLPVVVFSAAIDREVEPGSKYWWQIEIILSVNGEYEYRYTGGDTEKGAYSFDIHSNASMERDNGDYLLYKGGVETGHITWKETTYRDNESIKDSDLSRKISPVFELYYVMRREGKIYFDCAIASISLPFGSEKPVVELFLPGSAENETINPRKKYNSGISLGTNVVEVNEASIYREKEITKIFSWVWQGSKTTWPPISSSHRAQLKLTIRRQAK
ncbi:hypothetical protein ACFLRB_02630 [Acidobacteriota bacterium]